MILLVDVGNTCVKWALVDEREVLGQSDDLVYRSIEKTELSARLLSLWSHLPMMDQVFVANVAHRDLSDLLAEVVSRLWGIKIQLVSVTSFVCGVHNRYQALDQLGVDRWLAAIGARHFYAERSVIVVDVGTAINIELLVGDEYLGGVILPGVSLMHDVLVGSTHGVKSDIKSPQQIVGKSTVECVNSGVYYGLAGAIERVVEEMQKTLPVSAQVVLCGGGAHVLSELLNIDVKVDMNVVFKGLLKVARCES